MKKILILLIASLALAVASNSVANPKNNRHRRNVAISIAKGPAPHIHRSAIPMISAVYDPVLTQLEVEFNENFGIVRICILNPMLQAVVTYECDTQEEQLALIPCILDDENNYTIQITGEEIEAIGYID